MSQGEIIFPTMTFIAGIVVGFLIRPKLDKLMENEQ